MYVHVRLSELREAKENSEWLLCSVTYLEVMCYRGTCDIAHDLQALCMRQRATRVSCILYLCTYVVSHSMRIRPQHLQLPRIHHLLRAQRLCTFSAFIV